jgi:serine/threonine protein kinase
MSESAQKVISELTAAGLLSSDRVTEYSLEIESGIDVLLEKLVKDGHITGYQSDKLKAGKSTDIYFGDYVVIELLGQGGMGTVLLAKHRRMDREVAIKVLPVTALESKDAVARFYQEVKVAAQLTHPNIVHAYDAGEHHGFHYLVMEYVPGHDLAAVLSQLGPVPLPMTLEYIKQAGKGLDYAHRKGIIHRDIKPSNLLLNDEGDIKVLDMGLARFGGSTFNQEVTQLTTTGQVMGTVEYMSPEQAEDTRQADHRSDIYSLGCTMYRLLTGISPFSRDTVVKTILAHRSDTIPKIDTGLPEDPSVNALFQKMVAKSADDRFQSTSELLEAIETIENGDVWQPDYLSSRVGSQNNSDWVPSDSVEIVNPQAQGTSNHQPSFNSGLSPTRDITMSPVRTHNVLDKTPSVLDKTPSVLDKTPSVLDTPSRTPTGVPSSQNSDDVVYIPEIGSSRRAQKPKPSTVLKAMPIVALVLLFASNSSYFVPFGISWFTWRKARSLLLESLSGNRDDIDRGSARRIKWLSIVVYIASIIALANWLIPRIT